MFDIRSTGPDSFALAGRFDAARVDEAEAAFAQSRAATTLDLRELDYVASAGISVLLRLFKRLHADGHGLTLRNPTPHVHNVLRYAGLDQVFRIEHD